MMKTVKELKKLFCDEYGYEDELTCYFAPGRVNLIGEHIDYNGGMVFPATLSVGVYGIFSPRKDNIVRLKSMNASDEVVIDLEKELKYEEKDGWGNYPKGVIKYIMKNAIKVSGCDVLFFSDLPEAAGLSSSAAIEVLTGYMFMVKAGIRDIDRVKLSLLCQEVENQFIGVNCGIMDQFSVAMGKKDNAILLDCSSLKYEHIPFKLKEHSLVIMNTKKKRGLADSKYNERRAECEEAVEMIKKHKAIENLCQADIVDVVNYINNDINRKRAKHVVTENNRVKNAVEALREGNINKFGRLLTESHISLRDDYEVTGKELDAIVDEAVKAKGCIGARMTGAGFGGCAIALVENGLIEEFKQKVEEGYIKETGLLPEFYVSVIEDGVKELQG